MPDIFISQPNPKKKENSNRFNLYKQFFSAHHFMPDGIRFETQEVGETIILLLRKHWITNFIWITIGIFLLLLPIVILPAIVISGIIPSNLPGSFFSLLILIWYLFTFSYLLVNFLLWYFTVSIVTNERIVDIDFINILNKRFSATRISKVEDVTMRRGGFIRVLFDFGDVFIQTAGKEVEFEFLAVPDPEKAVRIINELMGKQKEE